MPATPRRISVGYILGLTIALAPAALAGACASSGNHAAPPAQTSAACVPDTTALFQFQVDRSAKRLGGPRLPSGSRRFVVRFVVDTTGEVDSTGFRLLDSAHADQLAGGGARYGEVADSASIAAAWVIVRQVRFQPAELHGCKVRELLQSAAPDGPKYRWVAGGGGS